VGKWEKDRSRTATDDLMSGAAWRKLTDALHEAGVVVYGDERTASPLLRAEGIRYLWRVFGFTEFLALEADPDYPKLVRMFDPRNPWGNANPDCIYFHAQISDRYAYRFHGRRGSARLLEITFMDEHIMAYPDQKVLATLEDIAVNPEGDVDILLSAKKPERHEGAWFPLPLGAAWIYVRQYFYDWQTEVAADLVLERVGARYPAPPTDPRKMAHKIEQAGKLMVSWYRGMQSVVNAYCAAPAGRLAFTQSKSGMSGQYYGMGTFECQPDEAVIYEFRPPPCRYWSVQLMNHYWESMDWDVRQTSINGHMATLDADGVFRAVIAHDDPGVPNWLDPAGHVAGLVCGRVLRARSASEASMKRVPLVDVRRHLPAETPVVGDAERQASLRRRMLSVARRHRE